MIVGIGVDLVDLARFERILDRTPALRSRLFDPDELRRGDRATTVRSLAGRFAAKEALIKAIGSWPGFRWSDVAVVNDTGDRPTFRLADAARQHAHAQGASRLHLSITHDAGVAVAYVIAEHGS